MAKSVHSSGVAVQSIQLRKLISELLPASGLPLLGRSSRERWSPRLLALCMVLMPLLGSGTLGDRFAQARDAVAQMHPTRRRPGTSYAGFVKALTREGQAILDLLAGHFRALMPRLFARLWHLDGRLVFAVDGTRIECPRTKANQKKLRRAGRQKTGPQFMLTTLFHVGTGLPWGWRRGEGRESEREHLRQMLPLLPEGAWLLADAGFSGYELLAQLLQRQIGFVIRVGANVRLLKRLGYDVREQEGLIYLWPQRAQEAKQPPLLLRLVRVRCRRQVVCLLVSELSEQVMSPKQVLELYRRRWGVEVFYRTLKQTLGRNTLQSDRPSEAQRELDGAMLGVWVLGLVSLRQLQQVGALPHQASAIQAVRVVRQAVGPKRHRRGALRRLAQALGRARQDRYQRRGKKSIRPYPRKKYEKPAGAPELRMATAAEIRTALRLKQLLAAA